MLLESKGLLSKNCNFSHTNLRFLLIQTFINSHGGPPTLPFWHFRCALSISGILEVIAHNTKVFSETFGQVTPAEKGLLSHAREGRKAKRSGGNGSSDEAPRKSLSSSLAATRRSH